MNTDLNKSADCHFQKAANRLQHYLKLVENRMKPANSLFKVIVRTSIKIGVYHFQTGAEGYFKRFKEK